MLTETIIGAAIEVHRVTGPGLMESVYEECLCYELSQRGLRFQRQVELPVSYKGIKLDCGFRMDLVVEDSVVLELKTVDQLLPIHSAQLLTYLKLSGKKLGLLINFNEPVLKEGLKRLVNRFRDAEEVHRRDAEAQRTKPIPSAPSALSGFDFESFKNSLKSLRLRVSAVNPRHRRDAEAQRTKPITSAPSALSGFDFDSLRLCVSAVNQRHRRDAEAQRTKPIPSAPSALSGFDFESLCLCVSAVNNLFRGQPIRCSNVS
jgi:GxxExxY protein